MQRVLVVVVEVPELVGSDRLPAASADCVAGRDDSRILLADQPMRSTVPARDLDLRVSKALVQVVDLALELGHPTGDAFADRRVDDTLGLDDLVGPHDAAPELFVGP